MTPEQYRRELDRAQALPVAQLAAVVRLLPADPSPRQWARFLAVMFAYINRGRSQSRAAAIRFYETNAGRTAAEVQELAYPVDAVDQMLTRTVRQKLSVVETPRETVVNTGSRGAQRHVDQSARVTVMQLVAADAEALGWARVLGPDSHHCAFCITLVSRGPVYKSQQSAGGLDKWHDGCDCFVVPVFNRDSWPGHESYLYAQQVYYDAQDGRGRPSVNNVRQFLTEQAATKSSAA